MRADRGDLLLMAFRRHRPVGFAALIYLACVGAAALTAEFAVPRLRDSTMFRFILPLCMTMPMLLGMVCRSWPTRRVAGADSLNAEVSLEPELTRISDSGTS